MDVERIQKINTLAVDLMKQGLAQDREEAVAQAEKIFRNRDSVQNISLHEAMQSTRAGSLALEPPKLQENMLSHDEVKNILEQNTKFLVNKIREFQDKIASLEKEIGSLRVTVGTIGSQRFSTPVEIESANKNVQTQKETASAQKTQNHPRSGNYKQEDVSIEKFFYMGK